MSPAFTSVWNSTLFYSYRNLRQCISDDYQCAKYKPMEFTLSGKIKIKITFMDGVNAKAVPPPTLETLQSGADVISFMN